MNTGKKFHGNDNFRTKIDLFKEISGFSNERRPNYGKNISTNFQISFERWSIWGDPHPMKQWKVNFLLTGLPEKYENIVSDLGKTFDMVFRVYKITR